MDQQQWPRNEREMGELQAGRQLIAREHKTQLHTVQTESTSLIHARHAMRIRLKCITVNESGTRHRGYVRHAGGYIIPLSTKTAGIASAKKTTYKGTGDIIGMMV